MPDDLDAFLQRAAQQRKARKPKIVVLDEQAGMGKPFSERPPEATRPPTVPPSRGTMQTPAEHTIRQAPPIAPTRGQELGREERSAPLRGKPDETRHEDVAAHVERHLDTQEFEQRAARLGAEVDLVDDKLEAHLHQVIDRHVGTIGGTEATYETPSAESFQTLFQSMEELRRAILLREILEPRHF